MISGILDNINDDQLEESAIKILADIDVVIETCHIEACHRFEKHQVKKLLFHFPTESTVTEH